MQTSGAGGGKGTSFQISTWSSVGSLRNWGKDDAGADAGGSNGDGDVWSIADDDLCRNFWERVEELVWFCVERLCSIEGGGEAGRFMKADIKQLPPQCSRLTSRNGPVKIQRRRQSCWPGVNPRPKVLRIDQVCRRLDCDRPAAPWQRRCWQLGLPFRGRPPHRGMGPHLVDNPTVMKMEELGSDRARNGTRILLGIRFAYRLDDCWERIFRREARGAKGARRTC